MRPPDLLPVDPDCRKRIAILKPKDSWMVLNLYSNGFSAVLAETVARAAFTGIKSLENGELVLRDRFGKSLPLSVFVRLKR